MLQKKLYVIPFLILVTTLNAQWLEPINIFVSEEEYNDPVTSLYNSELIVLLNRQINNTPIDVFILRYNGEIGNTLINVSDSDLPSFNHSFTIDNSGDIHVIWVEGEKYPTPRPIPTANALYYSKQTNDEWYSPLLLYELQEYEIAIRRINEAYTPLIDSKGDIHVVFTVIDSTGSHINHIHTIDEQWHINKHVQRGVDPNLTKNSNGKLMLVFLEGVPDPPNIPIDINSVLFSYSTDKGKTWSDPDIIHQSKQQPAFLPQILITRENIVNIIWAKDLTGDTFPNAIYHVYSDDLISWSQPHIIAETEGILFPRRKAIVDPFDNIHIAWWWLSTFAAGAESEFFYSMFNGDQWTDPATIFREKTPRGIPNIEYSDDGILHLLWEGFYDSDEGLFYSKKDISSSINEVKNTYDFSLFQNYPNPFNADTKITFTIHKHTHVVLAIYDLLGRKVATLVDESLPSGYYETTFSATDLASSIYSMSLRAGSFIERKSMVLIK